LAQAAFSVAGCDGSMSFSSWPTAGGYSASDEDAAAGLERLARELEGAAPRSRPPARVRSSESPTLPQFGGRESGGHEAPTLELGMVSDVAEAGRRLGSSPTMATPSLPSGRKAYVPLRPHSVSRASDVQSGARRCDMVAQELREERLSRNLRREENAVRAAEKQSETSTEAAEAASVAAAKSELVLRRMEAAEARRSPGPTNQPQRPYTDDARRLRGPETVVAHTDLGVRAGTGDQGGDSNDRLRDELTTAEAAMSDAAQLRRDLDKAHRELVARRKKDRGIEAELEELCEGHDPDAAALVAVRRELRAETAVASSAQEEGALAVSEMEAARSAGAEAASKHEYVGRELNNAHDEIQAMTAEITILRVGAAPDVEAQAWREREFASIRLEAQGLRAGRDADAITLSTINHEMADLRQELEVRRNRERAIAAKLEEVEAGLGETCSTMLQGWRNGRRQMAEVMLGNPAKMDPTFVPWVFTVWRGAALEGRAKRRAARGRSERLAALDSVARLRRSSVVFDHGLHARWFELSHCGKALALARVRAGHFITGLQDIVDEHLLWHILTLWRRGYVRSMHVIKAVAEYKGGTCDEESPQHFWFRTWFYWHLKEHRRRVVADSWTIGSQLKMTGCQAWMYFQAWQRNAGDHFAEKARVKLMSTQDIGHDRVNNILMRWQQNMDTESLREVLHLWAQNCKRVYLHQDCLVPLRTALELWLFGGIEGGRLEELFEEWSRRVAILSARGKQNRTIAMILERETSGWTGWICQVALQAWHNELLATKRINDSESADFQKSALVELSARNGVGGKLRSAFALWAADVKQSVTARHAREGLGAMNAGLTEYLGNVLQREMGGKCLSHAFSEWTQEVKRQAGAVPKLAGASQIEAAVLKSCRYLAEDEVAWLLMAVTYAWGFVVKVKLGSKSANRTRLGKLTSGLVNVMGAWANCDRLDTLTRLIFNAWCRAASKNIAENETSAYMTILDMANRNWIIPAWGLCCWRVWKELQPVDSKYMRAVLTQSRTVQKELATHWDKKTEPKMDLNLCKSVLRSWLTFLRWGISMRQSAFIATSLLERQHESQLVQVKQMFFALWCCQLPVLRRPPPPPLQPPSIGFSELSVLASIAHQESLVPGGFGASGEKLSPTGTLALFPSTDGGDLRSTPRHFTRGGLVDSLEALTTVRSRSWRLVCDIRTESEGALLRVGELHEAMLGLLEGLARIALHQPQRSQSLSDELGCDPAALGPMAEVLRHTAEAEKVQMQLSELVCECAPLSEALLEATAGAVRLVIDNRGANAEDARAVKMIAAELCELRSDRRRLADTCCALAARIQEAEQDLRSLGDARSELPARSADAASLAGAEARTLDGAGNATRQLLRTAAECVNSLRNDAHGLLQYLDASELLRSVAVWGVNDAAADAGAGPLASWPLKNTGDSSQHACTTLGNSRLATSWMEDEVLLAGRPRPDLPADAPAGRQHHSRDAIRPAGAGDPIASSNHVGIVKSVGPVRGHPDPQRLGGFLVQWRRPRLQTVWRAWLLWVQLVRRLRAASLDAALKGTMDSINRQQGTPGGLRPPRSETHVSVERLLLGRQ